MKTKIKLSLIFLLLSPLMLYAQKAPAKYGKVPQEDLEMTVYSRDTSAPAVVLCNYGYWDLSDYKFRRLLRIKILKKEGLQYANDVYPSVEETQIRGKTSTLENGEVEVTKLRNENIFKERVYEDYWRWRIAMPNVKVGSVIDIEFTHFLPPPVWYFQQEIPVRWSELIIPESQYIDYRKNWYGHIQLHYSGKNRWISKDVPAFVSEPFTNSIENYIAKYEIDILSIHAPGFYKEYSTDWDAVARRLEESSYYGGVLNSAIYLSGQAKEIKEKTTEPLERLKLALSEIKKVTWNEKKALFPSNASLGMVLREGTGNSADINIILVNLLRKLDIEAYPVIMSTRDNGLLPVYFPNRSRLNYTIAYAKLDEKEYLIDATDVDAPLGLLPERCLNKSARIVFEKKETTKSVPVNPNGENKTTQLLTLQLNEDQTLSGNVSTLKKEYSALKYRRHYKKFSSEEDLIVDFIDDNPGIKIKNYQVENVEDIYSPIKESYDIMIQNQVYEIDGQIFINPLLHLKMEKNPFKLEEREYPVDFPYLSGKTYIVKISVPEGYQVSEIPKPLIIELPDKAGKVMFQANFMNNQLMVTYKYSLRKFTFTPEEYVNLREFYNQIIKKQSEPIILNKI